MIAVRPLYFLSIILLTACSQDPVPTANISLQQVLGGGVDPAFRQATSPRQFSFPRDHGRHDGFRNEWWYITGNLETSRGRQFGFQVTFFRIALAPQASTKRQSNWATSHVWMAHVAVTDPAQQRHLSHERFAREAMQLAGTDSSPFRVWVGDWVLSADTTDLPWDLNIKTDDFELAFEFDPLTSPMLQGEQGLSQKSAEPGNASYYYSLSRLDTRGTLRLGDTAYPVSGLSWLDREWSSSSLGSDQSGWDWFSMQMDDGTDLMLYRLRDHQGNTNPHSGGSLLGSGQHQTRLKSNDFVLTPKRWWQSESGAKYPVMWELEVKFANQQGSTNNQGPLKKQWTVEAVLDDQEMKLSVNYWEGMVLIREEGKTIGKGYLEMTGYHQGSKGG